MRRSAGARSSVCPIMAAPVLFNISMTFPGEGFGLKPGIDSSLSSVPPVCPSARPVIIGTVTPQAAAMGASIMEVLSNASGAVLVDFLPRDRGQIQNLPRVSHFARERKRLIRAHAVQINGHEPSSDMIIRNLRRHVTA